MASKLLIALGLAWLAAPARARSSTFSTDDTMALLQALTEIQSEPKAEATLDSFYQFDQVPGGLSPGAVPSTGPPMGDMSTVVEMAKGFNAIAKVLRNETTFNKVMAFMDDLESLVLGYQLATEKQMDEVTAAPLDKSSKAAAAVAKIMLQFKNNSRLSMNDSYDLAHELNHSLPENLDPEKIIDLHPMMATLEWVFNNTMPLLESHMNGTIEDADAEFCDGIQEIMHRLTQMNTLVKESSGGFNELLQDTKPIDESPLVLLAPDIMPKFKKYILYAGEKVLNLGSGFGNLTNKMVDVSLRLLNDNQQCDLSRDAVESAAHFHRHIGLSATAIAVLASFRVGFGF